MTTDEQRAAEEAAAQALRPIHIEALVVRRPAGAWTPTVHAFLAHLRAQGLRCVPEPMAIEDDVETLGYLEGDSGGDGWFHQHDERGLRSAARLLRRIHDASVGWAPPADAVWGAPPVEGSGLVMCHGDPGPWNFVWRDHEAVGVIDWDFLHPGPRLDDVAYALRWFAPCRPDDEALDWHHFPAVPDRRSRIAAFLDAYGPLPAFDVTEAVAARAEATIALEADLAAQGQEPQRTWVADGSLERQRAEVRWIRDHRALLERGGSERGAQR